MLQRTVEARSKSSKVLLVCISLMLIISNFYVMNTNAEGDAPLSASSSWSAVFEDFEDISDTRNTNVVVNSVTYSQEARPEPVMSGNYSAKLEYDFVGTSGTSAAYIRFKDGQGADGRPIDGEPTKIGFWVHGSDKKAWLRAQIQGNDGNNVVLDFTTTTTVINGWKYVTANIPSTVQFPAKLNFIYLVETSNKTEGTLYFDDVTFVYDNSDIFALDWKGVRPMVPGEALQASIVETKNGYTSPRPASGAIVYSSLDTDVATIDANGSIQAHQSGQTVLTAVVNQRYTVEYVLTVSNEEAVPSNVQIEGPLSLVLQETNQLKAYADFGNGKPTEITNEAVFQSLTPDVVAVNGNSVQALAVGVGEVQVSYRGMNASYSIEIKEAELRSILIKDVFSAIVGGDPIQASVYGDYRIIGELPITSGVVFSSDNTSIATIDPTTGLIEAVSAGTTFIRANYNGKLAHQQIIVTNPVSYPAHELRGAWISTVENIDWPTRGVTDPEQQRQDFIALLDQLEEVGINAVFAQVRPTADSFYPSEYFPWSHWLTGEQGTAPADGYDPLAFMIEEAHKRNMEFHAWINPYRVAMHTDLDQLVENHPARENPQWVVSNNGKLYFNPAIDEARNYIVNGVLEIVENYNVDGIHMDDYFYPYPGNEAFHDNDQYNQYIADGGTMNVGDWRRNNVNKIVEQLNTEIKAIDSSVKFGISPFGIWRNAGTDSTGSQTTGLQSYDSVYADTRTWIQEGWVDYIAPQIYWHFGNNAAAYEVLVDWWIREINGLNDQSGPHNVHLYIGQAAYRAGEANWEHPDMLPAQIRYNRDQNGEVAGNILFSSSHFLANPLGIRDAVAELYRVPSLIPVMEWLPVQTPATPRLLNIKNQGVHHEVHWMDVNKSGSAPAYYAIYRADSVGELDTNNPSQLVGIVRRVEGNRQSFVDTSSTSTQSYAYAVVALSNGHQKGEISNIEVAKAKKNHN